MLPNGPSCRSLLATPKVRATRAYARLLGRHLARRLDADRVVVHNMDGDGSLRLLRYLETSAPKDGTVIATVSRAVVLTHLIKGPGVVDPRALGWIGSLNDETTVCVSMARSGVSDLSQAQQRQLIVGSPGPAADADQFPRLLNDVLATKFRVVTGYSGAAEVQDAMSNREIDGRWGSWSSLSSWVSAQPQGSTSVLIQMGLNRHPQLPSVPSLCEPACNFDPCSGVIGAQF